MAASVARAPWIHLEFDIPRLGRRVDAVLVLPECVIPIEFKVGEKKFERLDYEQAWDFRRDLKNFHAPSHAARRAVRPGPRGVSLWEGPLVAVLREALARDDFERLKKVPANIFTLVRKLKATAAAIAGRPA